MRAPSDLERAGLLIRAHRHGMQCLPEHTVDAEQGDAYAQTRNGFWHLWFVDKGRFQKITMVKNWDALARVCPNATVLPPGYEARLPEPPKAAGRGRYARRAHHRSTW